MRVSGRLRRGGLGVPLGVSPQHKSRVAVGRRTQRTPKPLSQMQAETRSSGLEEKSRTTDHGAIMALALMRQKSSSVSTSHHA